MLINVHENTGLMTVTSYTRVALTNFREMWLVESVCNVFILTASYITALPALV